MKISLEDKEWVLGGGGVSFLATYQLINLTQEDDAIKCSNLLIGTSNCAVMSLRLL